MWKIKYSKRHYEVTFTKITIAGVIIASLFLSGASLYAMNDTDLMKYILEQIKVEEKLSDTQIKEVEKDLEKISKKDILEELKEEVWYVEDQVLKKTLWSDVWWLSTINDPKLFFDALDSIYEQLDTWYGDSEWEGGESDFFSFEDEKKDILLSMKEELQYAEKDDIKKQIEVSLAVVTPITDEDTFFDMLDIEYEKIDVLYDKYFSDEDLEDFDEFDEFEDGGEYNFEDTKKEILEELKEEIDQINDTTLKVKLQKYFDALRVISDEDVFFDTLDEIYADSELEAYYEENGIEILDDDEMEDFDFETERKEILAELKEEIAELSEGDVKKDIIVKVWKLEEEKKEANFFDRLDSIYEKLDNFYGEDDEYEESEDFNSLNK